MGGFKKTGAVAGAIGQGIVGIALFALMILIIAVFLRGMVWASEKALPWLIDGGAIVFLLCVIVLGPMCVFRKSRPWAGVGFYTGSYVFGILLFAFSCLVTVQLWGYTGLFIGLVLMGVGVVPVAFLAALFHAEWTLMWLVAGGVVLTFGTRFLGLYLSTPPEVRDAALDY